MSKTEKLFPILLAGLFPALGFFMDGRDVEGLPPEGVAIRYAIVSTFLFSIWYLEKFCFDHIDEPWMKKLGKPQFTIILINALYILVFVSIVKSLPVVKVTEADKAPILVAVVKLSVAALIFGTIQYSFRAIRQKETLKIQNLELQAQNLKAQMETLKQQINPHFLFNSLNTLLDFIEDDRGKAVEFVRAFSNLYRIVLQSSQRDFVRLEDEIEFTKNYWNLLKMRFNDAVDLKIEVSEDKMDHLIPPLSLQLLIENAVKHNLATQKKTLMVEIIESGNSIIVQNYISPKPFKVEGEGVGLKNLQQRFTLLFKPIVYGIEKNLFKVTLPLKTT